MMQNSIVENLNSCLDPKAIELLMTYNIGKMTEFEASLRTKMVNLLHIREQQIILFE